MVCLLIGAATARAQPQVATAAALPEDLQPYIIGTKGTMMVGIAGYFDRFFSSERLFPTNYTAHVDVGRFISRRLVVRGGLTGSGSFGGDDADELATGSGAPAMHAFGGLSYYFTPQSIVSLYSAGEYWAQLTQRAGRDAGSIVGKVGGEGAVSSRVSLFLKGGYGFALTKGDEGERISRLVGKLGVRLKF